MILYSSDLGNSISFDLLNDSIVQMCIGREGICSKTLFATKQRIRVPRILHLSRRFESSWRLITKVCSQGPREAGFVQDKHSQGCSKKHVYQSTVQDACKPRTCRITTSEIGFSCSTAIDNHPQALPYLTSATFYSSVKQDNRQRAFYSCIPIEPQSSTPHP